MLSEAIAKHPIGKHLEAARETLAPLAHSVLYRQGDNYFQVAIVYYSYCIKPTFFIYY